MTTPDEAQALLPCPNPWCVSTSRPLPAFASRSETWSAICGCGVRSFGRDTEAEAITAWNTRSQSHSLPGDVGMRDSVFEHLVSAYRQGALDVHNEWIKLDLDEGLSDDPDFTEAAHDHAHNNIDAALTPSARPGDAGEAMSKRTLVLCVSGKGPTPHLEVHFANLADAHAAHNQLLGIKEEADDAR